MAWKSKKSTTDSTFVISVNDEEDNDCFSFEDSINTENCVSSFNFTSQDTTPINKTITNDKLFKLTSDIKNNELPDNIKTPCANGACPAINEEQPSIRRTYVLRKSTIRKLNELKSCHPDINAYISTIVYVAIDYYYNYIINENGTQLWLQFF